MKSIVLNEEMKEKIEGFLGKSPLFQHLSSELKQRLIAQGSICFFQAGEPIVQQGEKADTCFFLVKGSAKVWVKQQSADESLYLGLLKAGDCIGEMGLILEQERSATVMASDMALALQINKSNFDSLCRNESNFAYAIAKSLALRLCQMDATLPTTSADEDISPEKDAFDLLPINFIKRHRVLPLKIDGRRLTLGMVDMKNPNLVGRIKLMLPSVDVETKSIGLKYFQSSLDLFEAQTHSTTDTIGDNLHPKLKRLLEMMLAEGASDLHLSAREAPRWRVDGEMIQLDEPALAEEEVLEWVQSSMREATRLEFMEKKDTDFAIRLAQQARFRVNLFEDNDGVGAVLRLIPSKILSIGQLGLPGYLLKLAQLPKGLVLVTGATGSGKSTTLAAMIDFLNRNKSLHIITLEDPIEYVHTSQRCLVNQREIHTNTKGFNPALRAALRQDPDIVLVGELRDRETIQLALEVANTGHLVFATLHTASAITTIDRMVNIFPAEKQNQIRSSLSENLKGVVSQTLLKKKGGGRMAAVEMLIVNAAVANLIRRGHTNQIQTHMETGRGHGNRLMNDSLMKLIQDGSVHYDEAISKTLDKEDLAKKCGRRIVNH